MILTKVQENNTEKISKYYHASVVIRQKSDTDDVFQKVYFDFGDDIFEARQFVQMADNALTRQNNLFEVVYEEIVTNED